MILHPSKTDSASPQRTRAVWRVVSAYPHASVREIADHLGCAYSSVGAALHILADLGYIEATPGRTRARRVLVPFVEVGRV